MWQGTSRIATRTGRFSILLFSMLLMSPLVVGQVATGVVSSSAGTARRWTMPCAKSPELNHDGTVTFRLCAPNANSVHVYSAQATPAFDGEMTKGADGIWSYTTPVLPSDVYLYFFNIDGLVIADPANTQVRFEHFGETIGLSTVELAGHPSNPWDIQSVPHGSIVHSRYASALAHAEHDYYVYLPPGYDPKRSKPYPVLYLLHGLTEDATVWFTVGKANVMVDNYIAQGRVEPIIMVGPLGYDDVADIKLLSTDKAEQHHNLQAATAALLEEVMPRVEKDYNVSRRQKDHAIAGLSMGASQSLSIGLAHPEKFAYVGAFSPAFFLLDPSVDKAFPSISPRMNSLYKLIYFSCGVDDHFYADSVMFKAYLDKKGVSAQFVKMDGGHAWPVFRRAFSAFVLKTFKE
jgi:enterochelin esterase-like enzyme